jgi:aspartate aminotransferase-like enzyme
LNTYRLRLPGPTAVPERVRNALARPILAHRGPEFRGILARAEELIRPVIGTANHVFFSASTGTGMMEAALVNTLAPGERVLVIVHGQFGERFASIAKAVGAAVDTMDVEWGRAPDPEAIESRLLENRYRAVVAVHNESSTGVAAPLAEIGALVRDREELLLVDSVSGLGGMEMRMDEWGIDVLASSSQKCLMCPSGLGIAAVSAKAWEIVRREDRMPRYYLDFRRAIESAEKIETPFTSSVALIAGLTEALEMMHEEGLPKVLARHSRLSRTLRDGCEALGLPSFARENLSNTVVALDADGRGKEIVRAMYERFGAVIAGSRNKLSGRVIRIGTMGCVTDRDIETDLEQLKSCLANPAFA